MTDEMSRARAKRAFEERRKVSMADQAPGLREAWLDTVHEEFDRTGLTGNGLRAVFEVGADAALNVMAQWLEHRAEMDAAAEDVALALRSAGLTFRVMREGKVPE